MTKTKNPSENWADGLGSPVIPCLSYADAKSAISFLVNAFGLRKGLVAEARDGRIEHAQLTYKNGMVMLSSAKAEKLEKAHIYIVVEDVDAHCAAARAAGAEILQAPQDQDYGGRGYTARDPQGHSWSFGTYDPWAPASSLEYSEDSTLGLIELKVAGRVRAAEFEDVIERMERFFEGHEKVRLVEIIESFEGIDLSLLFDDVLFSLKHLSRFSHVAVVTDLRWAERMANAAAVVLPARLRVFPLADVEAARQWARDA